MVAFGRALLCFLAVTHIGIMYAQVASPENDVAGMSGKESNNDTVFDYDDCGKGGDGIATAVAGGPNASVGQYPWVAALGYKYTEDKDLYEESTNVRSTGPEKKKVFWVCTGALVTVRDVITTACCLKFQENINLKIEVARLGDLNLNDSIKDGASPIDYEVDSWLLHPNYIPSVNDIAIVKLKSSVISTPFVQPIRLPTIDELKTKDFTGSSMYKVGWGNKYCLGPQASYLREGRVDILNNTVCEKWIKSPGAVFDNTIVCTGRSVTKCQGESDHILMVQHGPDKNFYLYGVSLYGTGCALDDYHGQMFTRVTSYLTWILQQVSNETVVS